MARELLTRDDADPATLAAEAGYVKRIFKRIAPAVVWLTLLDGTTLGVTPEHEVYTEAQGWRYVSELETSSSLVDATGAPLTIVAIDIDPTPRAVYNLETSCGTYFAQGVWAHNTKGRLCGELAEAIARGARVGNTPAWLEDMVIPRLIKHQGATREGIREAIHRLKAADGLGAADNLYLDLTGNAFNPFTGDWIGQIIR